MRRFGFSDEPRHEKARASEEIDKVLGRLGFDASVFPIFEMWDREARMIARGSQAIGLQRTRLIVQVPSAVHRQELTSAKPRIISRINQAMGRKAVTDVIFELSAAPAAQANGEASPKGGPLRGNKRQWSLRKRYEPIQ